MSVVGIWWNVCIDSVAVIMNEWHVIYCDDVLRQNGYTALHIAAKKNQMDIVSTLVEHGARTSAESRVSVCLIL